MILILDSWRHAKFLGYFHHSDLIIKKMKNVSFEISFERHSNQSGYSGYRNKDIFAI